MSDDTTHVYETILKLVDAGETSDEGFVFPQDIADATGMSLEDVKDCCERLHLNSKLRRTGFPFVGPGKPGKFKTYVYAPERPSSGRGVRLSVPVDSHSDTGDRTRTGTNAARTDAPPLPRPYDVHILSWRHPFV